MWRKQIKGQARDKASDVEPVNAQVDDDDDDDVHSLSTDEQKGVLYDIQVILLASNDDNRSVLACSFTKGFIFQGR